MKAFIAGLVTLALLISAVVANAFVVLHKTDDLLSELKELPSSPSPTDCADLYEKWERSRIWISLTVHRDNVDDIDDTIELLKIETDHNNEHGYLIAKEKLICIVERLRKTESFSLERIF